MALSYKVFPGTPYYSNTALTTQAGTIVNTTAATYVNTTYGTVSVGGSTYYVAYGQMVSFYNSSFTGAQIDDAVSKRACIVEASLVTTAEAIYNGFSGALDNSGNPTRPIIIRRDNGITTTVDLALATVTEGLDGQTSYLLYTFTGVEAKTTYYLGIKKKGSTITFSPDYTRKNLQEALTFDTTPTAGSTNPVTSGGVKSALDNVEALTAIPLSDPAAASVAVDRYVVYQNGLYKTNAAIASGETATTFARKLNAVPEGGLNFLDQRFSYLGIENNGTKTVELIPGGQYLIAAANVGSRNIGVITLNSAGNVYVTMFGSDTGMTFTGQSSGTKRLTIQNTSGFYGYIVLIGFYNTHTAKVV